MYTKPEMLNNMRRNTSTTGVILMFKLHRNITSTIGISYLQYILHELVAIIPLKRERIFDLDLIL